MVDETLFDYLHMAIVDHYCNDVIKKDSTDNSEVIVGSETPTCFLYLSQLGYRVGYVLSERISKESPLFRDELNTIKYLCKELWLNLFKKQVDNLRTNHQGVYVIQDIKFRLLQQISSSLSQNKTSAKTTKQNSNNFDKLHTAYLSYSVGLIRGILTNLGYPCRVTAEIIDHLPSPTSSAKAASTSLLLQTNGVSPFTLLSGDITSMTAEGTNFDETDHDLDPELRVILRKLTKKDSTTKIRAFDELRDYSEECEMDDKIRPILPFFFRYYRKWSMYFRFRFSLQDQDQRVRDECQSTFDLIGMKMKKNLLPHLKSILPTWLMAQCDSYAPASSKAKYLYTKLFSGEQKQAEVVYYARKEIMSTLADELSECSDALKDKKQNELETDDSHERRLTQSLLALSLFLNYFDSNKLSELHDNFRQILDSGKFWKLEKFKSKQIQSSFYRCLFSLIRLMPDLMKDYLTKFIPLIFSAINESDPTICPLVWTDLLECLETFDDCWSHINYQKAFLPKLWAFLRHGCYGNVFGVKDALLSLISKIPSTVIEDKTYNFIENFFTSMEEGMLLIKGRHQANNANALLKAYMDCVMYILDQYYKELEQKLIFINDRMLPLIRVYLTDKECSIRNVYPRQYLYLLNTLKPQKLYNDHLNNVLLLFSSIINKQPPVDDLKYIFEQAGHLFETVLLPPKQKSLRFASSSPQLLNNGDTLFADDSDEKSDEQNDYLIELSIQLCRLCFDYCLKNKDEISYEYSLDLFSHLLSINNEQNSKIIITKLTEEKDVNSVAELFYLNYEKPLLVISIEKQSTLDHVLQLTIYTLNLFNSSAQCVERVLADLIKLESSRRFYFLLVSIVCRYESSPSFHTWLQHHGVLEQLLNMTATVTSTADVDQLNNDLVLPVSVEEFQLLSSLLCSEKSKFLTEIQKDQVVYLACRLFCQKNQQQQSDKPGSVTVTCQNVNDTDLMKNIDHVAKYLFERIYSTFEKK
ncbi:unnamed protein product [Didymodactylos carnosus]|uniref:E3 ubiquitin-protein ligase listerin n=3 Tax=Didymodactylos carnosus TaxID=1234261 RepID=A0A8S2P6Y4_9BILA|nr:unnamed protein product [Didymodactylos carnosus]CAF4038068.1 unnamed protein product [Didymodactylos carnosus]